jgi:hypothetical protein
MLTLWLMLLSCTNSGLGKSPTADTGPDIADCPWEGDWELTIVYCGGSFTYNEWFPAYDESTMSIARSGDGGCEVAFTWASDECAEEEQWALTPLYPELTEDQETSTVPYDGSARLTLGGISDCSPEGCAFDLGDMDLVDEPCEEGDRAVTLDVSVDDSTTDQLEIEGLFGDPGRHDCPLTLTTVWVRK